MEAAMTNEQPTPDAIMQLTRAYTRDGFGYTDAQGLSWMSDVGFRDSYVQPLVGPDSMIVGLK
jgi:hypothetical protein